MSGHATSPMTGDAFARFPARDREAFLAHWHRILDDYTVVKKTIQFDDMMAGNLVRFLQSGERKVGYWIGKEYWGRGVHRARARRKGAQA